MPFYVNCAILALTIPSMIMLIRMIPEAPSSVDLDAGDADEVVIEARKID